MTNKTIEDRVIGLLSEAEDDFSEAEEFIEAHAEEYDGDLLEFAFRAAVQQSLYDYVSDHIDDVELNDEDGYSSYLYETDDDSIKELLMDSGAFKSMDDYDDYRFAVETINWTIIAFDPAFQRELFHAYLEGYELTEKQIIRCLESGEEPDDWEFGRDIAADMDSIGVSVENGRIKFSDCVGEIGSETSDLIAELGYDCEFEGESWKLETAGVYYVE